MALAILSVAIFSGADWTRFLGPNGDSTSADKGLPDDWSATSNIIWKTELPGFGSSCPITVGDRIYLTCYSGYGLGKDHRDLAHAGHDALGRHARHRRGLSHPHPGEAQSTEKNGRAPPD